MDKQEIHEIYGINPDLPEVADILKYSRTTKYKKGDVILRPHDESIYWYRIRTGLVKIYIINPQDEESILLFYGPGDIFPVGWIIGLKTQAIYVQAVNDCELAYGPREILLKHLKKDVSVANAILRKVLEQFLHFSAVVNSLELKYGRDRLAYRLLVIGTRFGVWKDGKIIMPYISQQDLASALNMGRESVSREMKRFERLDLIKNTRKSITIKNPEKLRQQIGVDVEIEFYDDKDNPLLKNKLKQKRF